MNANPAAADGCDDIWRLTDRVCLNSFWSSMVNLRSLPRDKEAYLGWYLETAPEFLETYVCYAWEDKGDGKFSIKARADSSAQDAESRFEASRKLSLLAAKGKVFLGSWQQGEEYVVGALSLREVPTPLIRQLLLQGLHRLYERGFRERGFQVELDGLALELGVQRVLVDRAVDFLYERGLVDDTHAMGRNRGTGYLWLTHSGASSVETQGLTAEAFLQELYQSTFRRLFSINQQLAVDLEALRERAATGTGSRQEVVGFSSMVRDFVQELTDRLSARDESKPTLPRAQTINKVRQITARAQSETSREHVRALAEVVETHWTRLNDLHQKGVHEGAVEAQRLFAYTLLFSADLLDVVDASA